MVPIKSYVEEAIKKIPDLALTSMKKSMREEGLDADVILLAGGGQPFIKRLPSGFSKGAHHHECESRVGQRSRLLDAGLKGVDSV
jgi:plasmid segregation protein ParM